MAGSTIRDLLARRVLVLDGAMGTMLPGAANKDALVLSAPERVRRVHELYLEAGADIISTNTFRATAPAQAAYGLAARVAEMNLAAARLARTAADAWTLRIPQRPRFVAGVVGPVAGDHDGARASCLEQVDALLSGGIDLILIETIVSIGQGTAALAAVQDAFAARGAAVPIMVSATIDRTGRLPSGESLEAFHRAVRSARPLGVGLNCGFGARALRPFVAALAGMADGPVSCHPNAGLPDDSGTYPEGPRETADVLLELAESGLLHIAGGCCGTTPDHIRALQVSADRR